MSTLGSLPVPVEPSHLGTIQSTRGNYKWWAVIRADTTLRLVPIKAAVATLAVTVRHLGSAWGFVSVCCVGPPGRSIWPEEEDYFGDNCANCDDHKPTDVKVTCRFSSVEGRRA